MDRFAFLGAQSYLFPLESEQESSQRWPPAVTNTTSEVIFSGFCCFQDAEENYLFFRPAPPDGVDPSQLSIELAVIKARQPTSSDTTTDGNEPTGSASRNTLHARIDGASYAMHFGAILQIVVETENAALPPSFTLEFEDVSLKLYVTPGSPEEYDTATQGITQTVESLVQGFQGKALSPSIATHRSGGGGASREGFGAGNAILVEKTEAWTKLVDTALDLSVVMIRGEGEVGPDGLSRLMDGTAHLLATSTVRPGERGQLHAATAGARQAAEIDLDHALAGFIVDSMVDRGAHAKAVGGAVRDVDVVRQRTERLREAYHAQVLGELLPVHPT